MQDDVQFNLCTDWNRSATRAELQNIPTCIFCLNSPVMGSEGIGSDVLFICYLSFLAPLVSEKRENFEPSMIKNIKNLKMIQRLGQIL